MKSPSPIKKCGLVALMLLAGLFFLFDQWIPPDQALRAALSIPLLYFVPGFFLTKTLFHGLDHLETFTLSIFLSMLVTNLGVFAVEENTLRLTAFHVILITAGINIVSAAIYLAHRLALLPRLRAHIENIFHKGNGKAS